jgi:hypothetical protein
LVVVLVLVLVVVVGGEEEEELEELLIRDALLARLVLDSPVAPVVWCVSILDSRLRRGAAAVVDATATATGIAGDCRYTTLFLALILRPDGTGPGA